jgi:hypothetical protein
MKIYKLTLFVTLLVSALTSSYAQVGSPYSQYGMGDNSYKGFEQSKAMGGIGFGLRSNNMLNNLNPASYSALDSLSVIYTIGFNAGYNHIESTIDNVYRKDMQFGYFALGFRGNRYWSSSFGLSPVSKVDYTYKTSENSEQYGRIDYYLHGSGGLNKIYWGNSFTVMKNLSLGINLSYVFGPINRTSSVIFANDVNIDNTKMNIQINTYDFAFDYGIQYKLDLDNKSNIVFGLVYANSINLKTKGKILAGTTKNSANLEENYHEKIFTEELKTIAIDSSGIEGEITFPNTYGFGFSYNIKDKLLIGSDIHMRRWSSIENNFENVKYRDRISFRAGLEYIPNINTVKHYYQKVRYRVGGHYTKNHIVVNGLGINEYGVSFGFGLPLRNTKTSFNISCELGQRGTLEQNLLRETYAILSLNISLSDIWFVKRKFK